MKYIVLEAERKQEKLLDVSQPRKQPREGPLIHFPFQMCLISEGDGD